MAKRNVNFKREGNTLVIMAGYKESFNTEFLTAEEIIDRAYWIIVTAGFSMSKESIEELLRENRWLP